MTKFSHTPNYERLKSILKKNRSFKALNAIMHNLQTEQTLKIVEKSIIPLIMKRSKIVLGIQSVRNKIVDDFIRFTCYRKAQEICHDAIHRKHKVIYANEILRLLKVQMCQSVIDEIIKYKTKAVFYEQLTKLKISIV